jgi:hypothetical protein
VIRRLRALWQLLTLVPWNCEECQAHNETSLVVWDTMKYRLLCRVCCRMQNYPGYIRGLDPHPPKEP